MTISPLPPRTMLNRSFEQTRWHAIAITTLFWGGGGSKYQVSRIFAPDCRRKRTSVCLSKKLCSKLNNIARWFGKSIRCVRISRIRISVYPHIRVSAYPCICISAYLHICVSAYPRTRIFHQITAFCADTDTDVNVTHVLKIYNVFLKCLKLKIESNFKAIAFGHTSIEYHSKLYYFAIVDEYVRVVCVSCLPKKYEQQ